MSAVEEARAGRHAEAMQLLKRVIAAYDGYHMQDLQLAFKLSRHLVRVDSDAEQRAAAKEKFFTEQRSAR
jgi:hypothetical protein